MTIKFLCEVFNEFWTNTLSSAGIKQRPKPPKSGQSLDGQVAIVTGGNRGIGKGVSVDLASRGATVVIACRDEESANETIEEIKQLFPAAKVTFLRLDLSSYHSIKTFVQSFSHPNLDILVNNAGLICTQKKETIDGQEFVLGVNYLGPVLLTSLLIEKMEKSSKYPKIINVSAGLYHLGHKLDYSDLQWTRRQYDPQAAYAESKFATMLYTKELALRLTELNDKFRVKSVDPGVPLTDFQSNGPWIMSVAFKWSIFKPFGRKIDDASNSIIFEAIRSLDEAYDHRNFHYK